jgi:hypothetical protein
MVVTKEVNNAVMIFAISFLILFLRNRSAILFDNARAGDF